MGRRIRKTTAPKQERLSHKREHKGPQLVVETKALVPVTPTDVTSDSDLDTFLHAKAERIRTRMRESIIATGIDLLEVKERLEHGKFLDWIRAEFSMTERTAQNYMAVAERFGDKCETVSFLPDRVLYALAPASEAVVEQVLTGKIAPTVEDISRAKHAEKIERKLMRRYSEQAELRKWRNAMYAVIHKGSRGIGELDLRGYHLEKFEAEDWEALAQLQEYAQWLDKKCDQLIGEHVRYHRDDDSWEEVERQNIYTTICAPNLKKGACATWTEYDNARRRMQDARKRLSGIPQVARAFGERAKTNKAQKAKSEPDVVDAEVRVVESESDDGGEDVA